MAPDPSAPSAPSAGPTRAPVTLRPEEETLFIPLYAKALDFRSESSILHDEMASQLVDRVDFDFSWIRGRPGRFIVVRARQFDEWTREFLAAHPSGTVVQVGCGLDTRIARLRPPSTAEWIDLDFPDVIALRRRFFSEGPGYRMLGASLTDPAWLTAVPPDRPLLAVADGVFEYLPPDEVRAFVRRLVARAPSGAVLFDIMSSGALRMGNDRLQPRGGMLLRWAVDDAAELDDLDPRLRRTETISVFRSPYLPLGARLAYRALSVIPSVRTAIRLVRCRF